MPTKPVDSIKILTLNKVLGSWKYHTDLAWWRFNPDNFHIFGLYISKKINGGVVWKQGLGSGSVSDLSPVDSTWWF